MLFKLFTNVKRILASLCVQSREINSLIKLANSCHLAAWHQLIIRIAGEIIICFPLKGIYIYLHRQLGWAISVATNYFNFDPRDVTGNLKIIQQLMT